MKAFKRITLGLIVVALASAVLLVGCGQSAGSDEAASQEAETQTEDKGEVELAYVEWARAVALTHVAGEILDRMGYEVQLSNVANAAMWQAVANGDADAHMTAWLPATHAAYYGPDGEFTDDVEDLGTTYEGAGLGLVVPDYVEEQSVSDLVANADRYDGEITGIDPGAGMMQQTENAIADDTLGLSALTLLEGSGPTMTAALDDAVDNERPIVVTGWRPHWKFSRWDLRILEESEQIYGEAEDIHTIARLGLEEDKPEVYTFLKDTDWASMSYGPVMDSISDGATPEEAAADFVDANIDAINAALPDGMSI
ncbi:MAG: glycine/betaine ABC transporter substrate-binding protein [Spirochaetes bacterium]|jgi:glycine betaine/proline transport system substrate-binding protein|nr:glycine/betaine ABC transporter substrate-binding protein [Spirochaetota bacterium]